MPVVKKKQTVAAVQPHSQLFVILHDESKSRHFIAERSELVFAKKDNLKTGTYATFTRNGDRSSRCRGLVVLSGNASNNIYQNSSFDFLIKVPKIIVNQVWRSSIR